MNVVPEPLDVRRLVVQIFAELGVATPTLFDLEETTLIDDGKYIVRSYRIRGYMAM